MNNYKIEDHKDFNDAELEFNNNITLLIGEDDTNKSGLLYLLNKHTGILYSEVYDKSNDIIDYLRDIYDTPALKYLNELLVIVELEVIMPRDPKFDYSAMLVKDKHGVSRYVYDLFSGTTCIIHRIISLLHKRHRDNLDYYCIDTPENNIHPSMHHGLFNVYKKITTTYGMMLIISTNSPHFVNMSTNIYRLTRDDNGKTNVEKEKSQFLDRDIDTVLAVIMNTRSIPDFILKLHMEYRANVDGDGDVEVEAKLKKELLKYESLNSSFFQEMQFNLELL